MNNILGYSEGFLDGVHRGKDRMLDNFADEIKNSLKEFIDSNARVNPQALHHIYEWHETGSPGARLFDIDCIVNKDGISFQGSFRQSVSIQSGSKVPFYDKATIMERGIPVRIVPKQAQALAFQDGGQDVFVKGPVVVGSPGGVEVAGSFGRVFDDFFNSYFSQAFIFSSGILKDLENAGAFAKNLDKGRQGGRSAGVSVGNLWISKAGK
jgi:hypothetical protein